jgi:hypothetical protein
MAERTRRFFSNAVWSYALQLVTIISGFLVPRTIIGVYGSEVNGLVSSLSQIVSYITLVEAGISAAAVFALYKPLVAEDITMISRIVTSAKKFYYKSGAIFVVGVALLAVIYPLIVDVSGFTHLQIVIIVVFLGASGFLDFFTLAKYRVLLTATQRNWVIQAASIVYRVLYVVIIMVLAGLRAPIEVVYGVAIVPIFIRSGILVVYTRKKFPDVDYSSKDGDIELDQRWDAFYLQILSAVQSGAPVLIATFLLNDLGAVSVLTIYLYVANALLQICGALGEGTQASFGDVIARGQTETLQRTYKEFQTATYTLNALTAAVCLVLIMPFMALYTHGFTDANYIDPLLGFLVTFNVFLYHLKTPQGLLVISAGLYRETRIQTTIQTLILIIGGIAGGLVGGMNGIIVGACLSNIYRDIDLAIFIPRRVTHTPVRDTARRIVFCFIKLAVAVVPFLFFNTACSGWLQWILLGVISSAWAGCSCLGLTWLLERDQYAGLLSRMKGMVRR